MKTIELKANLALLLTNHGDEVLYSYGKAVAGKSHTLGYWKDGDTTGYHAATADHVSKYLEKKGGVMRLSSEQIEDMFM